jgi:D-psicose/D-tagatose/L-ribulose 3-epimerase
MEIKMGVNTLVWVLTFSERELSLIDKVSGMGFDVIELTPGEEYKSIDPGKLKNKLDQVGLEVSLIAALDDGNDISSTDETVRQKGIDYLVDYSTWAKEIDARIIGGPIYSALGKKRYLDAGERKAEWDRAADSLKRIGDGIARNDVVVALEPINRFEIDLMNTAEQGFMMCE